MMTKLIDNRIYISRSHLQPVTNTILMLTLILLNACFASPEEPNKLIISFAASSNDRMAYKALIARFEQINPDIHIRFLALEDILTEQSGQALSSAQAIRTTVQMADTAVVPLITSEDISSGLLQDLSPYMSTDQVFQASDYFTGTLEALSYDSEMYGIPRLVSPQLLFYNKSLWNIQKTSQLLHDVSWDDIASISQQILSNHDGVRTMYGFADGMNGFTNLIGDLFERNSAELISPITTVNLDRLKLNEAIERIERLIQNHTIYTSRDTSKRQIPEDLVQPIRDQQIAIWEDHILDTNTGVTLPFEIGTLPMPPLPKPLGTVIFDTYIMSKGTEHPQEAWRWLSFASAQPTTIGSELPAILPARRSLAEQTLRWASFSAEDRAAISTIFNRSVQRLDTRAVSRSVLEALNAALNTIVDGGAKSDAVHKAQSLLTAAQSAEASVPKDPGQNHQFTVSTPMPENPPAGTVPLVFGSFSGDFDYIRPIFSEFQQNNPGLFLQIKDIHNSAEYPSFTQLAATTDCFTWPSPPPVKELSATLDIQPLIDADASFPKDDIRTELFTPYKDRTGFHGIPYIIRLRTLSYNPQLFAKANLAIPTIQWKRNDLLAAAQALTKAKGEDTHYGYADSSTQAVNFLFFLELFGAQYTRTTPEGSYPQFTHPHVAEVVSDYVKLLHSSSPHRRILGIGQPSKDDNILSRLITEGRVGMWLTIGNTTMSWDINQDTIATAPLPLGDSVIGANIAEGVNSFYISANTNQSQACWDIYKRISGNPTINISSSGIEGQSLFPARRSIVHTTDFISKSKTNSVSVYDTYMNALDRAIPSSNQSSAMNIDLNAIWLIRAVDQALQGRDLNRELIIAQQKAEVYVMCMQSSRDTSNCLKQADPSFG